MLTCNPPPPATERTTSTTEGRIGGGETSETRAPPSSTNTSEEQQVDKSAENAFPAPVQVPEDLRDSKDLSLNDFESSLGKPWLKYFFNYKTYMKIKGFFEAAHSCNGCNG